MSDYDTIQKRRNLVVGLFVIIGLFSFGWLIFKFGDLPRFATQWNSYGVTVQFRSAAGAQKDTPVQFTAITQSFVATSQELSKVASEARLLLGRVNAGEGTLGRLTQDARFYENLLATTEQLQVLVQQRKAVTGAISERGLGRVWRKGTQ